MVAGGHYPQWGAIIQACTIHTLSSSQVSLQQNKKEERDTFQDMACVCVLLPNGGRGGGSISNSPCSILPKPYLYRAGIDMVFCRFCCFKQNFKQEIHIIHAYMPYQSVQKFLKQILQKTISTPERYRYGFSHFFSFNYSS